MKVVPISTRNYKNPPLVEALIDIQITPSEENLKNIEKLITSDVINSEFPHKEALIQSTTQININEEKAAFNNNLVGYKLSTIEKKYVVQFKVNSFSISILNAYHGWDDLYERAFRLWPQFAAAVKPQQITRVAVRYINRIDIPLLSFKLPDYFNVYPKTLEPNLKAFSLQLQIPQKEGGLAVLNQTVTTPIRAGYTSIILDLDIFNQTSIQPEDSAIWKNFEILHTQKNILFEKCITDKTRELFS
jgi:uncharacterized protein (TIGR04255 family)